MLAFIQNWYYKMDSYLMILKCDLKYWKEEGIFDALHDDPDPIHSDIIDGWFNHKL